MGSRVIPGECSESGSLDKGWLTSSAIVDVAGEEASPRRKRVLIGILRVLSRVKETSFANPRFEKSFTLQIHFAFKKILYVEFCS